MVSRGVPLFVSTCECVSVNISVMTFTVYILIQLSYTVSNSLHCVIESPPSTSHVAFIQKSLPSTTTIYISYVAPNENIECIHQKNHHLFLWVIRLIIIFISIPISWQHTPRPLWRTPWVCLWRFAFFWVPMTTSETFTVVVKKRNNSNESMYSFFSLIICMNINDLIE